MKSSLRYSFASSQIPVDGSAFKNTTAGTASSIQPMAGGWVLSLHGRTYGMAVPNDDPTVQHGDRTIQLIDWLVERLEECLGEVLPLQTDDLLKDYAKDARNSMASAIEQLSLARAKKEQQLGGRTS
jgi:hypothetical protein